MPLKGPTAAGLMYSDTGGDGPVVVLLHGVLMNGTLWDTVTEGLGDRYRCIVGAAVWRAHHADAQQRRPLPAGARHADRRVPRRTGPTPRHTRLQRLGRRALLISPGGTDRVAKLVLISCEAFDNYPPGVAGQLLCRTAAPPGGTFLTAEANYEPAILVIASPFDSK